MTYFITNTYLKDNTPVGQNVDSNLIVPIIKTAADSYVRSILGTYFYNYLLTKFNAQTLSVLEITLVQDFIQMAVAWRACSDAVMTTSYQTTNKGIQTQSGDFSASPEYKAIMFMVHEYKSKGDFYDKRLENYLTNNGDLYPEFMNDLNDDSITPKKGCRRRSNTDGSGILFI